MKCIGTTGRNRAAGRIDRSGDVADNDGALATSGGAIVLCAADILLTADATAAAAVVSSAN